MSKPKETIIVNFHRVDHTAALVNYFRKRLSKHKTKISFIESVECKITRISDSGSKKFIITVNSTINNIQVYFSEKGNDLYKMIDNILSKISRKYNEILSNRPALYNLNYSEKFAQQSHNNSLRPKQ